MSIAGLLIQETFLVAITYVPLGKLLFSYLTGGLLWVHACGGRVGATGCGGRIGGGLGPLVPWSGVGETIFAVSAGSDIQ